MLSLFIMLFAPAPATEPATLPDLPPAVAEHDPLPGLIHEWFTQLADADPARRDLAAEQLMGLRLEELPKLEAVMKAAKSILPAQEIALRDVVTHIYFAAQSYAVDRGGGGFIGVSLATRGSFGAVNDTDEQGGAVIYSRIPGCIAYRRLRDGDVIVGIREGNVIIPNRTALMDILKTMHAGDTVTLLVQRGGKQLPVSITLDKRPAGDVTIQQQRIDDQQNADDLWDTHFAPLFKHPSEGKSD